MLVDAYKLTRWMNVRKLTPSELASQAGVPISAVSSVLDGGSGYELPERVASRLARTLRVAQAQIERGPGGGLTALVADARALAATRRAIKRDGIHFYNYYSMASPRNRVGPVILDILCPPDRLPALNQGHLEPAITVNLGPGDINGRWAEELRPDTWQVLAANDNQDHWICGDSYVEPSYCPHSYSLTGTAPARIVSYTSASPLASFVAEVDDWTDSAFECMLADLGKASPAELLRSALVQRGLDEQAAARVSGLAVERVRDLLARTTETETKDLKALCDAIGADYRCFLPAPQPSDPLGKVHQPIDASRATTRSLGHYTFASMAMAPYLPDLTGAFLKVAGESGELDLRGSTESHYLVSQGDLSFRWADGNGSTAEARLTPDASVWVAPYVAHSFSGQGTLLRFGSGQHLSHVDQLLLSSTFAPIETMCRARHDRRGWGYDPSGT